MASVEDVPVAMAPQPNFEVMATCMHDSSKAQETFAIHLGRMGNIPTLDRGLQILEEIRLLGQRLDQRLELLGQRLGRGLQEITLRLDSS